MRSLRDWELIAEDRAGISLGVEGRFILRILVPDRDLIRLNLLRDGVWRLDRSWSVAPGGHVPWEGRSRDDLSGFPRPGFDLTETAEGLTLDTGLLRVTVARPLCLSFAVLRDGVWTTFAEERPTGAWAAHARDHRHAHYLLRRPGDRIFGLGEKAGPLERTGSAYEMRLLDAMGYDAATTDPLYKHIPFTLTQTAGAGAYSLFYDNLATCRFDLGRELDNYHRPYRAYRAEDGDLDLWLRWAPDLLTLVKAQTALTGGTAFPPRWSLGYSGSTMAYTDAPDAQAQLLGFLDRLAEHAIPCDSFQMSSGYTSIGTKRYVFHWNREKVPDPEGLARSFRAAGVELVANIKPCLLHDHPRYREAARAGLFVQDAETGGPERSVFWDDEGSHLDFTNPATIRWWQEGVTRQLLARGIGSTWNDNNEFEVWDDTARCAGFGDPVEIGLIRPLMSLLMTRASEEAQRAHAPGKRPYLISRAGCPGIQRHAQTWTGDNRTGWDTLRWNIRMGLGLALSGISNIGHDVGGFAGPRPEPELFLRWVQNGIFHPRFTIHSWNDDGSVNSPWMHPEVLPQVRAALALRYRLIPYLYTLLWQAVSAGEPMLRPLFLDHPADPGAWEDCDEFLLGRDLLVASVVEPGATLRRLRLPVNATGWWDVWRGTWHAGGTELNLPVGPGDMPLFARGGCVIPLAEGLMRADPAGAPLTLWTFPAPGEFTAQSVLYADDGESQDGHCCITRFTLAGDAGGLRLGWTHGGAMAPQHATVTVALPAGETRGLRVRGETAGTHDFGTGA